MLEPRDSPMKWPGSGTEDEVGEATSQNAHAQARSQDDAAVHYVFQRDPQESELLLAPKQRWVVGDDSALEVSTVTMFVLLYYQFVCLH